jgi:trans-aconitate methyltransferase
MLDVGCGTGYLLRSLGRRYADAQQLCGIDAAPQMIATARAVEGDDRLSFATGVSSPA